MSTKAKGSKKRGGAAYKSLKSMNKKRNVVENEIKRWQLERLKYKVLIMNYIYDKGYSYEILEY